MTNKDIKDYCKNCDVEPPAMRFKCPECEHNPNNENNFAKDINAPHKEQIIINGKGCRYKTYDAECSLTGDHYGDNLSPCKFIDEKSCYFKQLARKEQECEELKRKVELMMDCADCKVDKYKQALDEIEKELKEDIYCENQECGCDDFEECLKCTKEHILDIINKAKGKGDD